MPRSWAARPTPTAIGMPDPTIPVDSTRPDGRMGDVHGPALAPVDPGRAGEDLGDQRSERHALGHLVVESPVGGDQLVVGPQDRAERRGDGLLAGRRPVGAGELAAAEAPPYPFVARADEHHQLVHPPPDLGESAEPAAVRRRSRRPPAAGGRRTPAACVPAR